MTNPFLDDKAQAGSNPFLGIEDGIEPTRPGPAVISAQQNEPDSWATAKRKGAALGLAPEIVYRNPAEVRKLELQQSLDQVRKTNPALADWLVRDDNLTLAQDDTESLGFIGRALEYPTEIASGFNSFVGAGISGLGDINDAVANRATAGLRAVGLGKVADALEAPILPDWANPSKIARGVGDTIIEQTVYETPKERRNMGHDVAQGLGSLVGQVVATYVNPAAAVTLTAGQGAEQQATRAEGEGASTADKSNAVLIGATITAATEKMGLDILLERLPPAIKNKAAQWVADKILAAGAEGAQEGLEQVAHNAVAQLTYAPDSPLLEGVGDNATLGALVGGLARTVLTPGYHYHERRQQGQSENQQVDALSKMVQQSKLFARDPQKLADYIAGAKQTGASNVYLPAEDVTTLFQSVPEAAAAFEAAGVSRESILETTALNSDLAIPLETYLTKIAPGYHAQLGKAARLSPDAITDADVDVNDEQNAAVKRFLASVNDAPAEGQADMRVYNDVLGQLLGRYQQADAEQMASVVNAFFRDGLGARAGIDPMALYDRYGLRIVEQVERRVMGRVDPEVDSMIERLRAGDIPTEDQAYGPTLAEFLSGPGIRSAKNEPMSGEIRTLAENDRATRKGRQRLVREEDANALTLDYAREAAVEAGYLSPDATLDDLLAALNDGGRAEVNRDGKMSGLRDALTEMDREISRLGLDVSKASNEEIRRALFGAVGTELDQANKANPAEPRRGFIQFGKDRQFTIGLTQARDMSTFLHEFGHFALEVMGDIAADADANPEIAADYAVLLSWLGVNSREEIGVEQHEKMARGFEKYLGEGTPPTPELAGAFARFRSWMKAIYKSLTSLNVDLNPEVRGVMSRMLAGDAAIAQAEQATVAEPLFKEASLAGMTEPQFAAYLELQAKAHDEAETRIVSEAYNEVMRERKKWWREESNRIETEVRAEFEAMPVYRAWAALARNTEPNGTPLETPPVKLSKQWLVDRYGQKFLNKNLLNKRVYAVDGGVHGDMVAPVFGYETGPSLVESLSNATPLNQAIKAETASRMRELHGDMRNDGTLPERAMKAVHGNRRMKVIEAEIAALSKLVGEPAMTTAQARSWAQKQVAGKRIKDIVPYQYLRAERKAARESLRAANAGKMVESLAAARRRLANAVMYDEVVKARKAFDKRQAWIKRQTRSGTQEALGKAGVAFRDQFNAVLASLSVRPRTDAEVARQKPLSAWVESMAQAGMEVAVTDAVAARVDAGAFINMRDMTVAEFTEAYEALKSIKHAAGNEKRLLTAEGVKLREDAITEMLGRAETALPKVREAPQNAFEGSTFQRARMGVREVLNSAEGPEAIIEMLDGDKSGPWREYLWKPWQDAQNKLGRLRRKFVDAHNTLRKSLPDGFYQSLAENVTLPWGQEAARGTLLSMALNTGTQSNIDRLKNGGVIYKGQPVTMTDEDVQALRDLLTADEARYVQGLWDIAESNWPEMVKLQTDVTGIPPEKVQSVPSTANGVPLRGGYWMLVADSDKAMFGEQQEDSDALRAMMGNGVSRATTLKGQFKSRAENAKYPLKLDFGSVLARNLDNVFTDLSYRKAVIDITRLLHDQRVKDVIQTRIGKEAYRSLKGGLAYSVSAVEAAGNRAAVMSRFINKVTSNLSVAVLALRVPLALGNYGGGILQAADRTGIRAVMRGMLEFNVNRGDVTEQIKSLSPYMANRLEDIDYQYRQELGKTQNERGYKAAFTRVMMAVHRIADNEVSRAAWWGQYKTLTDNGVSSSEAAQQADAMIRLTQTRTGKNEVSTIERDPRFTDAKQFMGPMFVMLSRLRAAATGEGSIRGVGARSASVFINIFLANAVFQALAGRLPDDDDDDGELSAEEWVLWFVKGGLFYPLQMLPYVREFGAGIEAWSSDKPINPRAAPTAQAAAGLVKASKSIWKNVDEYRDTDELDWTKMTLDLATVGSVFAPIPVSQTRNTIKGIEAVQDDPDAGAVDYARMALYGPPKK